MNNFTISITNDFSEFPAGRYYPQDGDFPGEKFRNDFLIPALKKYETVTVVFDNEEGYGSSFIEEAFGGLVRDAGFKEDWLNQHLKLESLEDNEMFIEQAWDDIRDAQEILNKSITCSPR